MQEDQSKLSDEHFLYSNLHDFLDGALKPEERTRMTGLVDNSGGEQFTAHYQNMRGRLQIALQSYYLKENEMMDIKGMVQDPTVKATQEQSLIQDLEREETFGNLWRRLVLVGIAAGLIGAIVWQFLPEEPRFKPLEYLGYEALALEEEGKTRLDLPTADFDEVRDYLTQYPGLGFSATLFEKMKNSWSIEGTTVIDYEVAKVAVVQYAEKKSGEKIFLFSFIGSLAEFPKSQTGNFRGLTYQAYANDRLNFIVWQQDKEIVSLLVGRKSTLDLAEIAVEAGGKG